MQINVSDSPDEIFRVLRKSPAVRKELGEELPYPFSEEMLTLLKKGNPLPQRYYFIESGDRFAFFTVYDNRMDLFTFGRARLFMNIQTIAFPCSLSSGGYITNDPGFMLGFIKSIKGCKLVLNVPERIKVKGMSCGETLPTCILTIPDGVKNIGGYINCLRSPYRRRLNLALKRCGDVDMELIKDGSCNIYPLYLQTFERSDYKLEQLGSEFFDRVEGDRLVFSRDGSPIGFVLLKKNGNELIFLLCGMDYEYDTADLYYMMLLKIVEYAIENGCRTIDLGQTSEKTKLRFGAVLEKRYFYAHHTNPFLNLFAVAGRHLLEYKYDFPTYNVFKV